MPNPDYEPGNYVKLPKNVFMKIVDANNGLLDLEPTDDDIVDSVDPTTVRPDDCEVCLTPHQFGQVKRHSAGGTGFKKKGRKFKYPRSKFIDSFIKGDKDAEHLLEQSSNSLFQDLKQIGSSSEHTLVKSDLLETGQDSFIFFITMKANSVPFDFHVVHQNNSYDVTIQHAKEKFVANEFDNIKEQRVKELFDKFLSQLSNMEIQFLQFASTSL